MVVNLSISVEDLPIGFRFVPNEEQLIRCYLEKRVNCKPVPPDVIREVFAPEFYSKPPYYLAGKAHDERGFYFLIHNEQYFNGEFNKFREVGNGIGIWISHGYEEQVYDRNANIIAYKTCFDYFSTQQTSEPKMSRWTMELYRLINTGGGSLMDLEKRNWVLGRFRKWEKTLDE